MSGTTVIIMRHGTRHKVPVDLDRPLHEALTTFCAQVGIDADPTAYTLASGNKTLDLTLSAKQQHVVSNALLMFNQRPGGSALGTEVKVAVQSSSGGRAMGSFTAGTVLADVLIGLASGAGLDAEIVQLAENGFAGVSVVFMRTQVAGTDLCTTSLAKIGATKGSVSLRLNLPKPEAAAAAQPAAAAPVEPAAVPPVQETAAAAAVPAAPTAMEVDPPVQAAAPPAAAPAAVAVVPVPAAPQAPVQAAAPAVQVAAVPSAAPAPVAAAVPSSGSAEATAVGAGAPDRVRRSMGAARAAVTRLRGSAWDKEAGEALGMLIKILDNLIMRPGDPKVRSIRYGNAKFQTTVGQYAGGVDVLLAAGFVQEGGPGTDIGGEASYVLNASAEDDDVTLAVRGAVAAEAVSLGVTGIGPPPAVNHEAKAAAAAEAARVAQVFDPFKPILMRVEADAQSKTVRPAVKVLDGGASAGAAAGAASGPPPSAAAFTAAGSAAASGAGASSSAPVPPGSPMTAIERRVADLKARAEAIQASSAPADRATRVILHDRSSGAAFNPNRFTAEEQAGGLGGSEEDGSAAAAGAGGSAAGGAGGAGERDMDVDDDGDDMDSIRLQMEVVRKRIKSEKEEAEKGFRTRAMRELETLSKAKVFTTTLIRVVMPDRTVIQGTFSPRDSVTAIRAWLAELMLPGDATPPFFIYTTPPPAMVDTTSPAAREVTMASAKLQPAAVLYLGWGTGLGQRLDPAAVPTDPEQYLRSEVLDRARNGTGASSAAAGGAGGDAGAFPVAAAIVQEAPSDAALDAAAAALLGGQKPAVGVAGAAAGAGGKAKAMPSWLKLR